MLLVSCLAVDLKAVSSTCIRGCKVNSSWALPAWLQDWSAYPAFSSSTSSCLLG
jgi:hypothetical protein